MKIYILYICVVLATSLTRSCSNFQSAVDGTPVAVVGPLVDTLSQVYDSAHAAAVDRRLLDFAELADTSYWNSLEVLAAKRGFNSVESYLGNQGFYWPRIDTLTITEIRQSGPYARLTAVGPSRKSGQPRARVHYTFILFHHTEDGWLLAGWTDLEKDQLDHYGYSISYHETELPPQLRFPRLF